MIQEWITVAEAVILFSVPKSVIWNFVRNGTLKAYPCEVTGRPKPHPNVCRYLRLEDVEAAIAKRRPEAKEGDWLSLPDAAAYLSISVSALMKRLGRGHLHSADWLEIPEGQRMANERICRTYLERDELDRFAKTLFHAQAQIVPDHHSAVDLAYAAGLFDGEGCVILSPSRTKHRCYYTLAVTVTNTHRGVMGWLQETFGAKIQTRLQPSSEWKTRYTWCAVCVQAYWFLRLVRPYLQIKDAQADLAIEFYRRMIEYRGKTRGRVSDSELTWRAEQAETLHHLNRRGSLTGNEGDQE